jgi:hypothetical protein
MDSTGGEFTVWDAASLASLGPTQQAKVRGIIDEMGDESYKVDPLLPPFLLLLFLMLRGMPSASGLLFHVAGI